MRKTMLSVVAVLALLCSAPKHAQALNDGTPSVGSFSIITVSALSEATATGTLEVVSIAESTGASITIGTVVLKEGRDWRVGATTMTAAISLRTAINAANIPVTATYTNLGETGIALTADYPGALYNGVGLRTSNSAGTTVSAATLTGGKDNAIVYINAIPLVQGRDWFAQDVASNTAVNLAAGINLNAQTRAIVRAAWPGGTSAVVYLRSVLSPVAYTLSDSAGTAITESAAAMSGGSAGNITPILCDIGSVNALPTSNYPAGCSAYLISDPSTKYLSVEPVTSASSWVATNTLIASGAIDTAKIAAGAVDTTKLHSSAPDTGKIPCFKADKGIGTCASALTGGASPRCDTCQ